MIRLRCDLIVGARPNFMKAAPVAERLRASSDQFAVRLIHTGQHYDARLSDVLFTQLGMPAPELNLGIGSGSQAAQTARIMTALEDVFTAEHPRKDFEQNTVATFNMLEAMRANGIRRIAFSSTGSIYGEPQVFPTPETAPFPVQTSFYGASKLAGEGLIQAYCEGFGLQGFIFRFVSILGERYSHGHVFDFYQSLRANANELRVLGNGRQRKSYLYVQDCIDAMLTAIEKSRDKVSVFNLGTDEYREVNDSIGWITAHLGIDPARTYTGGRPRMDRRQPFHLSRHDQDSIAWLETEAVDPGRDYQDTRLPHSEPLVAGRTLMKVCVLGLWHLGTVTAACLASGGHDVIGLDFDPAVVAGLEVGKPPLFEPGLEDLVKAGLASGRLRFTTDGVLAVADFVGRSTPSTHFWPRRSPSSTRSLRCASRLVPTRQRSNVD